MTIHQQSSNVAAKASAFQSTDNIRILIRSLQSTVHNFSREPQKCEFSVLIFAPQQNR